MESKLLSEEYLSRPTEINIRFATCREKQQMRRPEGDEKDGTTTTKRRRKEKGKEKRKEKRGKRKNKREENSGAWTRRDQKAGISSETEKQSNGRLKAAKWCSQLSINREAERAIIALIRRTSG